MTWQELSTNQDLIGKTISLQIGGKGYRGPIKAIEFLGPDSEENPNHLKITVDWLAFHKQKGGWQLYSSSWQQLSIPMDKAAPPTGSAQIISFLSPNFGDIMIFLKEQDQLDPAEVEGLDLTQLAGK